MIDEIKTTIAKALIRSLELDPNLSISDAIHRLIQLLSDISPSINIEPKIIKPYLEQIGATFKQKSIVNLQWLQDNFDMHFYFFLIELKPGMLPLLKDQLIALERGISNYILFGEKDSLIIFFGTSEEAKKVSQKLHSTNYYYSVLWEFNSCNVELYSRYQMFSYLKPEKKIDRDFVNRIIDNYNEKELVSYRKDLENKKLLLGPKWESPLITSFEIIAFTGIKLQEYIPDINLKVILETLMKNEILKACIVDFYELDRGSPYQYFIKLVCRDMKELDLATDAISYTRFGKVCFEGKTYVVATGQDEIPKIHTQSLIKIAPTLNLEEINYEINEILINLGEDYVTKFNKSDIAIQLQIYMSLLEITQQINRFNWSVDQRQKLITILNTFTQSCLESNIEIFMRGPITEIMTMTEGNAREFIQNIAEKAYKGDLKVAQSEMRLPTKDFETLTLGKIVFSLEFIHKNDKFVFVKDILDRMGYLGRLNRFTKIRNEFTHDTLKNMNKAKIIDLGRWAIIEAIEINSWLIEGIGQVSINKKAGSTKKDIFDLPNQQVDRNSGIFIVHAHEDESISERIALALKVFTPNVFLDKWGIKVGEKFVDKIHAELAKNDKIVILLSPNSIESKWVQHEINIALIRNLADENVILIPVIIKECEIPSQLKVMSYVDLSTNWNDGVIKLLNSLFGSANHFTS